MVTELSVPRVTVVMFPLPLLHVMLPPTVVSAASVMVVNDVHVDTVSPPPNVVKLGSDKVVNASPVMVASAPMRASSGADSDVTSGIVVNVSFPMDGIPGTAEYTSEYRMSTRAGKDRDVMGDAAVPVIYNCVVVVKELKSTLCSAGKALSCTPLYVASY